MKADARPRTLADFLFTELTPLRRGARLSAVIFFAIVANILCSAAPLGGASVARWSIYEITLPGPTDGNPFLQVDFSARFTDGTRVMEVPGFYDGDGIYRIRFLAGSLGVWHYETLSNRWPLAGKSGSFTVVAPAAGNHGPVQVYQTYHFAYADGAPYHEIGTTIYNWLEDTDAQQELTLKTLAQSPFNKVRMLVTPADHPARAGAIFPFQGQPPHQWDLDHFNPEFFRRLEKRVGDLGQIGIEADLILFHPYGKSWGFDAMPPASDDRYLRYVVARLAAYHNVWWSLANEYDFVRTKTESDWDRLFQVVQQADPFSHLRSIHNGALLYNNLQPWVTHASIQNGSAVENAGRAVLYRDVYRKPVVFDEVKYEGDSPARWGQLTAPEMVHRFWSGTVAGTYVGHGEAYVEPPGAFLSHGGVLRGQSPPRIAFLRQILEESPAAGIDPIDKWQDERIGGQPGEYYLVYFGHETPTSWPFQLYKSGVAAGQTYSVDVIDTWGMTVARLEGLFTLKRKDNYYFVDINNRAVPLPGRAGMALRIRRVGGTAAAASEPINEP